MPSLATNLDVATRERIASAFHYVDGARVLRLPVVAITLPPTIDSRTALHPVVRARLAADDEWLGVTIDRALAMPLARVGVYAAYLAYEWTPTLYELAIEKAGALVNDGMPPRDADRRAIAIVRGLAKVTRVCSTCRFYRLLSAHARRGVCEVHERTVEAHADGPDCWMQAYTLDEYAAAMDHEVRAA